MALDMVLNDLSLTPALDIMAARSRMSGLVQTLRSAFRHGMIGALRTHAGLRGMSLADNYPFDRWANDPCVSADERLFMLRLATKSPYWQDHIMLENRVRAVECWFNRDPAQGLGVAVLLDTLAVSLASDPVWDHCQLRLRFVELTSDAELSCIDELVHHACSPDHVEQNSAWIRGRLHRDVRTGHELWERRTELTPSLLFCDSVRPQLETLNRDWLPAVVRHLFALQTYCCTWTAGAFCFHQIPLTISTDSEATLNRFGDCRTFVCPDGNKRLFSLHTKGTPGPFRVYFLPGSLVGQVTVGYIGPHLPTVKFH